MRIRPTHTPIPPRTSGGSPTPRATRVPTQSEPASPPPAGLSTEEARMIQRYFPENPGMTLKLYGPGTSKEVHPQALGNRIDLRG